jgi:hypothetical protein
MKPKSSFAISLLLIVCLLIPGLILWSLQNEFQVLNNIDSTPLSEFEYEEYAPDLSNRTMISSIEANAEFKFPQSARDIYSYTTGLRDISIQTRFTINADELPVLISSTRCKEPLQSLKTPVDGSMSVFNWWKLAEAQVVMGCSGATENFGQMVYIDMSHPEIYIVYIEGGTR